MKKFQFFRICGSFAFVAGIVVEIDAPQAALFEHEISQKPAQSVSSQPVSPNASSIGASAVISYQALTDALSSALPMTFDASGRQKVCGDLTEPVQQTIQKRIGGDVGKFLGRVARFVTQVITVNQLRHVCQDVDYKVDVNRTSPVTVSAGTNKVHVTTNIAIDGHAGFSGDLAKAFGLNSKHFRGGIAASADIALDIDEHWCPHLQATADYRWTDRAELEIVHNVWLGIEGQVGDKVKDQINNAVAKLQSSLTCAQVTNAVKDIWHPYIFPILIPNVGGSTVYLSFVPSGVGFSGISYAPTDLALALSINGAIGATTAKPSSNPDTNLPALTRIPAHSDKISVTLPIEVGYEDASALIQNLLKQQSFQADTPAGHVKVNVTGVKIYPSDGKLALALQIAASTGHQLFDTKGTVYLLGVPALDSNKQVISIRDVSFTAIVDNALWSTLATVLNGPIKTFIEQRAVYDLSPKIADLQSKLQSQLATVAAQQKVAITLNRGFAGLHSIQLEEKALNVTAGFEGQADLVVRDIVIPPTH
jgi:hypothetical protein